MTDTDVKAATTMMGGITMAKLTSQIIEELYSYGKVVHSREISI